MKPSTRKRQPLIDIPFRLDNGMTLFENEQRKNTFKQAAVRSTKFGPHLWKPHHSGLSVCEVCGVLRLRTAFSHCHYGAQTHG